MNLEEELRAVLSQEAEMRTTPTPDIEGMVRGGQDRRHRRNTTRIGLAAAAVVLAGGTAYGVAQLGDDPDPDPNNGLAGVPNDQSESAAPPSPWEDTDGGPAAPGTYRTFVGVDAADRTIEADLTIEGSNWHGSNYPVAYAGEDFAGVGAYQVEAVAGGSGCLKDDTLTAASDQPQQLAQQLAGLPRSEVVQPPAATVAFGHDAIHLRTRINAACAEVPGGGAAYRVVETTTGGRGIGYFEEAPADPAFVVVDFWVVDVDGTTVVVDLFRSENAPQALEDQAAAASDSITFVLPE